jgi:CBS domain-containing protein
MSQTPACCAPDMKLPAVAKLMIDYDCGEIPVCESRQVVGVVTDRDIACRAVAAGLDPSETPVRAIMTSDPFTVSENAELSDAATLMEAHRVRRLPVTREGRLVGIISQADLIQNLPYDKVLELLTAVSKPVAYS